MSTRRLAVRSGEIRTVREYLGLSRRELSQLLQVSEATVQNWEKGKYPPPPGVATEIARLEAFSGRTVQAVLDAADHPSPCLLVYRQDADMPPPDPPGPWAPRGGEPSQPAPVTPSAPTTSPSATPTSSTPSQDPETAP